MKCPRCAGPGSKVVDSRNQNSTRRRRRECGKCGHRYTTTEVHGIQQGAELPLLVADIIKRDGELERFDEKKLRKSIFHACSRRKLSSEAIEELFNSLVVEITDDGMEPIDVGKIVDLTTGALASLDKMAALRYAIQYNNFATPAQFRKYTAKLEK